MLKATSRLPMPLLCAAFLLHLGADTSSAQENDSRSRIEWRNDSYLSLPLGPLVLGLESELDLKSGPEVSEWEFGPEVELSLGDYLTVAPGYRFQFTPEEDDRWEHGFHGTATIQTPSLAGFTAHLRNKLLLRDRSLDRYRIRLRVKRGVEIGNVPVDLFVGNEQFFDWTEEVWIRNRLALGGIHDLTDHLAITLAYMHDRRRGEDPRRTHRIELGLEVSLN